jgi:hypothetical protein
MHAIYGMLSQCSLLWLGITLYLGCVVAIRVIRDFTEGLGYNIARSSEYGDVALIGFILIGVHILQRGGQLTDWYYSVECLVVLIVAGIAIMAVFWVLWWRSGDRFTIADAYHHTIVAPLFGGLIAIAMQFIVQHGSVLQQGAACALAILWFGFVVWDYNTGRMAQWKWLEEHGFRFSR